MKKLKRAIRKKSVWEEIGYITVDAGCVMLADPSYVLDPDDRPKQLGKSWKDVCDNVLSNTEDVSRFGHGDDPQGAGVIVHNACDGMYPVEVKRDKFGITEVRIRFVVNHSALLREILTSKSKE